MSTTVPSSYPCGYCGSYHSAMCPRVKSIEYHNDGTVKRVEFHDKDTDAWYAQQAADYLFGGKTDA